MGGGLRSCVQAQRQGAGCPLTAIPPRQSMTIALSGEVRRRMVDFISWEEGAQSCPARYELHCDVPLLGLGEGHLAWCMLKTEASDP